MDGSSAVVYIRSGKLGGLERGLAKIAGKPMIEYVLDALPDDVEDLIIAVENGGDVEAYVDVADRYFAQVVSSEKLSEGARRFVEFAVNSVHGDRVVILPGDAPLITRDFASFLLECSKKFTAALPRNPARKTIYLMASYQTKPFREAFAAYPEADMEEIVRKVGRAIHLSSISLKIFDEKLGMFFRISSVQDLKKAEKIIRIRGKREDIEIL